MLPGEATAFRIECDARAMSALGQSRQIDTAPGSRRVRFAPVSSIGQCNTSCSLLAGVSKAKVFRGR
jgi:hypothetical protein